MLSSSNHYARLDVTRDATADEIRRAYFEAARRLHPDTNPDPKAGDLFIELQEAYEVLSNPERRTVYDASLPIRDLAQPAISISTVFSRSEMPPSAEPQLIYALVELTSIPDTNSSASIPLNLCLILDRSTSMKGARMEMVKSNAIQFLRQMRPQDIISVVTFSDWAEVIVPATRVMDVRKIESRISQLQTGGGTEIFQGLEAGITQVRSNLDPSYINHVVLLTDGRTYGDETACLKIAEQAAEQGIAISGLGIGHEWNDAFLDSLAAVSGGTSTFITAPYDLHNTLQQKYNTLGKIYAEQVTLDFDLGENIALRCALRLQPDVGMLPTAGPIRVGNIVRFKSLMVLFEFLVKDIPEEWQEMTLLNGAFRMEIPTRSVPKVKVKVDLKRPVNCNAAPEKPPQVITQALSQLTLYRLQEKARQEVQAGEVSNATRHLQYLATHLLSQGERDLAHVVLMEAEHILKNQQFSKEGEKRIKYGTRALLLPPGSAMR